MKQVIQAIPGAADGIAVQVPRTEGGSGERSKPRPHPIVFWNDIRACAYQKWQAAGSPPGDCTRFWLEAEEEPLKAR